MQKISELKQEDFIYNHVVYDNEAERHLAKHSHPLTEMIYVLGGEVSYTIENKRFTAQKGDLILIKPFSYHFFSITGARDYEKIGILFPPSDIPLDNVAEQPFLLLPAEGGRIGGIFDKVDFYYHNCPQDIFKELALSLAKEIVLNIQLFHQDNLITAHNPIHPLVERAIEHINNHLFSLTTVKELAATLGVSEGYLKALFTEQMKIPPKQYLTEKKMLRAKAMLLDGEPPTQVAIRCGYNNYVTFYRLYVKFFGNSPTEDRKSVEISGE
jgi:AraC-like DNA-binding protein/quercetin dioxygenase-like cupin family protein